MASKATCNDGPRYQIGDEVVVKEGEAREYGTVVDAWSLPGGVAYLIRLVDGVREVMEDDIVSLRHS
jgi:hypothetical protein